MVLIQKDVFRNNFKFVGIFSPQIRLFTYLISISFFFLYSGIILSQAIVKRPSLSSAPPTFTSSAIVNDLANCLCEIPLWIISPSSFLFSDLSTCFVLTVNKLSSNSTSTSFWIKTDNHFIFVYFKFSFAGNPIFFGIIN